MSSPARLTRFDGLRALAILAVIYTHTAPAAVVSGFDPGGGFGVQLFFVLSGFLITGILLDVRGTVPTRDALRVFYLRRAVRIFPAYYVVLGLSTLVSAEMARDVWWHAAYLSNVKLGLDHAWGHASHLWSLAVEEQFYLVWPVLVLTLPRRWLPRLFLGVIVTAPVWRVLLLLLWNKLGAEHSLAGSSDCLAIGAWLAWCQRDDRVPFPSWLPWAGLCGVLAMAVAERADTAWTLRVAFMNTPIALVAAGVMDATRRGVRGTGWLAWRPLVYLGTISYGMYLVHNFVRLGFVTAGINLPQRSWGTMAVVTVVTIALASVSWFALEQPMNRLKRYATYGPRRAVAPVAVRA